MESMVNFTGINPNSKCVGIMPILLRSSEIGQDISPAGVTGLPNKPHPGDDPLRKKWL